MQNKHIRKESIKRGGHKHPMYAVKPKPMYLQAYTSPPNGQWGKRNKRENFPIQKYREKRTIVFKQWTKRSKSSSDLQFLSRQIHYMAHKCGLPNLFLPQPRATSPPTSQKSHNQASPIQPQRPRISNFTSLFTLWYINFVIIKCDYAAKKSSQQNFQINGSISRQ